ncbi:MAG: hypothetical protein N2423_00915 [Novosphingobium sp.]|nr:hypothetical protein [Novosphingobium sp.]
MKDDWQVRALANFSQSNSRFNLQSANARPAVIFTNFADTNLVSATGALMADLAHAFASQVRWFCLNPLTFGNGFTIGRMFIFGVSKMF